MAAQGNPSYGIFARIDTPYEQAIEKITAALKDEGFGVLTEIDVKKTLKEKIGKDFRRYVILGACSPNLASQALETELDIGLLLPCNVIVYEEGDKSVVAAMDPIVALGIVEKPELQGIAQEARQRLTRAIQRVKAG
ncbi:MAG: DUF302 domain-containing protein [Chloroflexi bacterium]|nr:DUF302 domain-containing protein [Chloroflexota bacterium]